MKPLQLLLSLAVLSALLLLHPVDARPKPSPPPGGTLQTSPTEGKDQEPLKSEKKAQKQAQMEQRDAFRLANKNNRDLLSAEDDWVFDLYMHGGRKDPKSYFHVNRKEFLLLISTYITIGNPHTDLVGEDAKAALQQLREWKAYMKSNDKSSMKAVSEPPVSTNDTKRVPIQNVGFKTLSLLLKYAKVFHDAVKTPVQGKLPKVSTKHPNEEQAEKIARKTDKFLSQFDIDTILKLFMAANYMDNTFLVAGCSRAVSKWIVAKHDKEHNRILKELLESHAIKSKDEFAPGTKLYIDKMAPFFEKINAKFGYAGDQGQNNTTTTNNQQTAQQTTQSNTQQTGSISGGQTQSANGEKMETNKDKF